MILWGCDIFLKLKASTSPHFFKLIIFRFKINIMSYKKDLIVTDPSKLPGKWWNYLVNPIVGYYIPKTTLYKKQKV